MSETNWEPGERLALMLAEDPNTWTEGVWQHLGFERGELKAGEATIVWKTTTDHAFPAADGWIVHGGLVTTVLDTAMGQATGTLMNEDEAFLTADLHTEFYRPTTPGLLTAVGRVVHKTKKLTYAMGELFDEDGRKLASARCTNVTISQRRTKRDD